MLKSITLTNKHGNAETMMKKLQENTNKKVEYNEKDFQMVISIASKPQLIEIVEGVYCSAMSIRNEVKDTYLWFDSGVCDNYLQAIEYAKDLIEDKDKSYTIIMTPIQKSQNEGWRWHKNGQYIGTQNPQHEHLGDEEHIDIIYRFQIFYHDTRPVQILDRDTNEVIKKYDSMVEALKEQRELDYSVFQMIRGNFFPKHKWEIL